MNVEQIKQMMAEISSAHQDSRESGKCKVPEDALKRWHDTLNESLLKTPQMEDAEDAALFRALAAHTWEFNTSFDKESQPKMIKAVFKITTLTSESMSEQIRALVKDFGKNADKLEEEFKK